MTLLKFNNYQQLSQYTAEQIVAAIIENPCLVLCMASGHTPLLTAQLLVQKLITQKIDYSKITFFGLDEWLELEPSNEGSCHYFLQTHIIKPLKLANNQYHLFDGLTKDTDIAIKKMDDIIASIGSIDLMLVGIGMNGHIGFNEPGTPFNSLCHVAPLHDTTKTVGQKYFSEQTTLQKGITIGLGHLMQAKKVFLQANGVHKAAVIKQAIEDNPTPTFPASIVQLHTNSYVLVDEDAASGLKI
jgi:glucosamine-6-phosphate isomerase